MSPGYDYGSGGGGGYGAPASGGYGAPASGGYGAPSSGGYGGGYSGGYDDRCVALLHKPMGAHSLLVSSGVARCQPLHATTRQNIAGDSHPPSHPALTLACCRAGVVTAPTVAALTTAAPAPTTAAKRVPCAAAALAPSCVCQVPAAVPCSARWQVDRHAGAAWWQREQTLARLAVRCSTFGTAPAALPAALCSLAQHLPVAPFLQ